MLLKTQGAFSKRTQNEPNFECQMHRLNPNSELSQARARAGGLRLEIGKGTEAIRSRKSRASREQCKNNTNEASMLLKTNGGTSKTNPKPQQKATHFAETKRNLPATLRRRMVGRWGARRALSSMFGLCAAGRPAAYIRHSFQRFSSVTRLPSSSTQLSGL